MRKIIIIILLITMVTSFSGCNKENSYVRVKYLSNYLGYTYQEFLEQYKENKEKISKDFYVLAPQDYRDEENLNPRWGLALYESMEEDVLKGARVFQTFYVCNEQKYGKQTTDWGQYSGVAINFKVYYETNVLYEPKIGEDIVVRHISPTYSEEHKGYVDIYQGTQCFASAVFEFFGRSYDVKQKKNCMDKYIQENLLTYSEYIARNERGDFIPNDLSVENDENLEDGYMFWDFGSTIEKVQNFNDEIYVEQLEKYGLTFLYLETLPTVDKWDEWPKFDIDIKAKDVDENGNVEEIYFVSTVECWDGSLGGNRFAPYVINMRLEMITIPLFIEEFDLSAIRCEEIKDGYNLYYNGLCCATIRCGNSEYYENYIKTYLRYYNPNVTTESN